MIYSGFATPKDYSILGMDKYVSNLDKKPYQLLLYSSGLGFDSYNESAAVTDLRNAYHKAAVPSTWGNHAGSDVPLYAVGSLANLLFSGTMDQNYVPHAIAFAMCLFKYQDRCFSQRFPSRPIENPRDKKLSSIQLLKQEMQKRENYEKEQSELKKRGENYNFIDKSFESSNKKIESSIKNFESSNKNFESSSKSFESSGESFESSTKNFESFIKNFESSSNDTESFENSTESFISTQTNIDVVETSDLVGNLTEIAAGSRNPSSLSVLVLFLVAIVKLLVV